MAMFIQGGIFLTQRLKCFYLKHLFTFQSKKKKTKASELPAYICPQPRHRHSIRAAQGRTFLALSPSRRGDSHLPPASMDHATATAQKARQCVCCGGIKGRQGSGERDWRRGSMQVQAALGKRCG